MWPFKKYKLAKKLEAEFASIYEADLKNMTAALKENKITEREYFVMSHMNLARNLAFAFVNITKVNAKYSPLADARDKDLIKNFDANLSHTILLGYTFQTLKQVMTNKPEIAQIAGCSFDSLLTKFSIVTGRDSKDLFSQIKRCEEHLYTHGGDPIWSKHETINDFLQSILQEPPPSMPTDVLGLAFTDITINTVSSINKTLIERYSD